MFRQSALRRELEATERELANQKWVLERFLESPAWRMTYPIRWLARQARKIASPSGRGGRDSRQAVAPGEGIGSEQILKPSPRAPSIDGPPSPPTGEGSPGTNTPTNAPHATLHT